MFVNCIPLKGKTSTYIYIYIYTVSNDVLVIDGMHFGILINFFFMNLMNDDI